jgi:hypothetical protein
MPTRHGLCKAFVPRPIDYNAALCRELGTSNTFGGAAIMTRMIPNMREGKAGWVLLWLLGVPIPILLLLFMVRGCT